MQTYTNNMPFYPANAAPTPNGGPIANQPPKFALPQQMNAQPQYYYADSGINFGKECGDSIEHILRGLTSAVNLLLDEPNASKCQPNTPPAKQGSWCFPDVNYTNVQWTENNYWNNPLPVWNFDQPSKDCTQTVTKKFTDFFCR